MYFDQNYWPYWAKKPDLRSASIDIYHLFVITKLTSSLKDARKQAKTKLMSKPIWYGLAIIL